MNCRDFGRTRVKLLLSTPRGSFGIHPRHTTFSPRSNDLASLCHWRPGLNREICCWGHYAVNLGIQQKNTDSTFHHLSHVSRRKWRSKRRVLGFLWLLGTNFVGLAGETSFTHLNLSRKYGRGPMTFHENLIFLSGMFSFLVEFLAYWGMKMINSAAKTTFPIQIRDICRLSWGLAPPWRLSRGGLAYCGLYFGFLPWNWRFTPKFV